jgi:hypothetical protein
MANWKITIKGAAEAPAAVQAAIRQGALDGLELAGVRGEQLVKVNIATPFAGHPARVSTGIMANAITHGVEAGEKLGGTMRVFAQPPADTYAGVAAEFGRLPGKFPPLAPLVLWVKQKFGIGDEKQARSVAFLLARKIARRGIAGHFAFQRALEVLVSEVKGIFERTIGAALERAGAGK